MPEQTIKSILQDIKKELHKPASKLQDENLIEHIARLYTFKDRKTTLKQGIDKELLHSAMTISDYQKLLSVLDAKGGELIHYNVLDKGASLRGLIETRELKMDATHVTKDDLNKVELLDKFENMKNLISKYENGSVKTKEKFFDRHGVEIFRLHNAMVKAGLVTKDDNDNNVLRAFKNKIQIPILEHKANQLINKVERAIKADNIDYNYLQKMNDKITKIIDNIGESSAVQNNVAERFGEVMIRAAELQATKPTLFTPEEFENIDSLAKEINKLASSSHPQPFIREDKISSYSIQDKEKAPPSALEQAQQKNDDKGKESASNESSPVNSPRKQG